MPTPRKSIAEHALAGTKPHYVEPASEVSAGRPKFPAGISPDSKRCYKRLCALLAQRGVLTAGDSEILRLYAIAFTRHERACAKLLEGGEVVAVTRLDSNGSPHIVSKESIWLRVATDAEKFMRACLSDLGLNPLQRGKIKPAKDPKVPQQPSAEEQALFSREAAQAQNDEPNLDDIDESVVN